MPETETETEANVVETKGKGRMGYFPILIMYFLAVVATCLLAAPSIRNSTFFGGFTTSIDKAVWKRSGEEAASYATRDTNSTTKKSSFQQTDVQLDEKMSRREMRALQNVQYNAREFHALVKTPLQRKNVPITAKNDPLILPAVSFFQKVRRVFEYGLRRGGQEENKPGLGVAFLKTPKCGGTTVATVLANLVLTYGLKRGEISFGHHTMSEFKEVEHSNGQAVGLVREPGSRFQSAWTWREDRLKWGREFADAHGCRAGHEGEWSGLPDVLACCLKAQKGEGGVFAALRETTGSNELDRMAYWHTGVRRENALNFPSEFRRRFELMLQEVMLGKHLVLVLERLEESLIVLRHAYGLTIDDIVHVADQNVKHGEGEATPDTEVSALRKRGLNAVRALHPNDRLLYKVANETLDRWLRELGPDVVEKDLTALRERTAYFMNLCHGEGKKEGKAYRKCLLVGKTWSEISEAIKTKWNAEQGEGGAQEGKREVFSYSLRRGAAGGKPGAGLALATPPHGGAPARALGAVLARAAAAHGLGPWDAAVAARVPLGAAALARVPWAHGQVAGLARDPGARYRDAWAAWAEGEGGGAAAAAALVGRLGCRAGREAAWAGLPDGLACALRAWESEAVAGALRNVTAPGGPAVDQQAGWLAGWPRAAALARPERWDVAARKFLAGVASGRHLVLVAERMEESLVVLRRAYGLPAEDVVLLAAGAGPRAARAGGGKEGAAAAAAALMERGLAAARWLNERDAQLHAAAGAALDRWVARLGRAAVAAEAAGVRARAAVVRRACQGGVGPRGDKDKGSGGWCALAEMTWEELVGVLEQRLEPGFAAEEDQEEGWNF